MEPSPVQHVPGPSRRSVLATGAVVVLAAGCTVSSTDPDTPATSSAAPTLSPDVAVAVEAARQINAVAAALRATTATYPGLATAMSALDAMHAAHLAAVQDAVPDRVDISAAGDADPVPADRAAALAGLLAAERSHHDQLVGLAMRAQSGLFAGLLGRMAASVSQHLAVLR